MGTQPTRGAPPLPRLYRFGVFEADTQSGELRKSGSKIRLQEQPFQILLMLLERPGEVVTREDMRQRLWSDTFVDFDHGLNTAINKLRDALGDTATSARFIETLARRGYRFLAPVQRVEFDAAQQPASGTATARTDAAVDMGGAPASAPSAPLQSTSAEQTEVPVDEQALPRPARGLTRLLFALVQIMYLVFYVVALVRLNIIHGIVDNWRPGLGAPVMAVVLVTACVGIAIRLYLFTAVSFDFRALGHKFRRIYPAVLPLDQLWALVPFLAIRDIGVGAAFAACAALLYLPFSERTLIRMSYRYE